MINSESCFTHPATAQLDLPRLHRPLEFVCHRRGLTRSGSQPKALGPLYLHRDMSAEAPDMSAATRELLGKVRQMVPPMLEKFHKGP